jgi:hypothetical protein
MSQMTSPARGGARPLSRPATVTPRLRVVTGAPLQRGAAVFGIICACLLAVGLVALLLLNTALAQGSFTLSKLQATSEGLNDTEVALNQSLGATRSPANLASMASSLGMVPVRSAAFLRLSDGKVIGVAKPASPVPGFTVVGIPTPAATQPADGTPAPAATQPVDGIPAPAATQPADATPAPGATQPPDGTTAPAATQPANGTPAPGATQPPDGTTAPAATQPANGTPAPGATQPAPAAARSVEPAAR